MTNKPYLLFSASVTRRQWQPMALATLAFRFLCEKTVLPDLITLSDHCNNLKLINLLAIFASSVHFDNLLRANLEHYCADALSHKF